MKIEISRKEVELAIKLYLINKGIGSFDSTFDIKLSKNVAVIEIDDDINTSDKFNEEINTIDEEEKSSEVFGE